MKILDDYIIQCDNCGNLINYKDDDIKYIHELHDESSKVYAYKIKYIECIDCRSRIILEKIKYLKDHRNTLE